MPDDTTTQKALLDLMSYKPVENTQQKLLKLMSSTATNTPPQQTQPKQQ